MPRPSVVGMQPQEGSDQTYGELGQGLYAGSEISANMRIHPSRTFLPGQTYTPEVRAASVSDVCSSHPPCLPRAHPVHVHARAAPGLAWGSISSALNVQGLVTLAQDLVKPEFTAKKYVPETPTEKMKNAQARVTLLQAVQLFAAPVCRCLLA